MNPFRTSDTKDYYVIPEKKYPKEYWDARKEFKAFSTKKRRKTFRFVFLWFMFIACICTLISSTFYFYKHSSPVNQDNIVPFMFVLALVVVSVFVITTISFNNLHADGDSEAETLARQKSEMEYRATLAE